MNLIKEAFDLKAKGLNNTQIARKLAIRRQDLVVIFKYLEKINPRIFDELEEIDELKKQLKKEINLTQITKKEIENKIFVLQSKIENLNKLLNLKEDEAKEKQNKIIELSNKLRECNEDKSNYEKELIEVAKSYEEAKQKFIDEINDLIEQKEEIIKDLENKLKRCKPIRCYIARTFNLIFIVLILGTIGAVGYFVLKYKIFDIKKEVVKKLDYDFICYVLGDFEGLGIRDYKYQFCYYRKKSNK